MPQNFDILIIDAFTDDAIPFHLLTLEAFQIYLAHLNKTNGILAVHISNTFLDLKPVVAALAHEKGLEYRIVNDGANFKESVYPSVWILLSHEIKAFSEQPFSELAKIETGIKKIPVWTDNYSNLFRILK